MSLFPLRKIGINDVTHRYALNLTGIRGVADGVHGDAAGVQGRVGLHEVVALSVEILHYSQSARRFGFANAFPLSSAAARAEPPAVHRERVVALPERGLDAASARPTAPAPLRPVAPLPVHGSTGCPGYF